MDCQETITATGSGTWYLPYEVQLVTVHRELRSRYGEDRRETTRYEFRFRKPGDVQWDRRDFETGTARDEFMARAFENLSLSPTDGDWRACGHLVDTVVGQRLVAIEFVLDYLKVQFDDHYFTCAVWPVVWTTDGQYKYGQAGYRDALCSLLSQTVTRFEEYLDAGFVFEFGANERIEMALVDPLDEGFEVLTYHGPDNVFGVWR
ncbi:MAG TPA: hypothetical protein PLC98_25470 [Anaerolineales bacterium]|nr:hypothetical protein [Anaerolineales bacterium]